MSLRDLLLHSPETVISRIRSGDIAASVDDYRRMVILTTYRDYHAVSSEIFFELTGHTLKDIVDMSSDAKQNNKKYKKSDDLINLAWDARTASTSTHVTLNPATLVGGTYTVPYTTTPVPRTTAGTMYRTSTEIEDPDAKLRTMLNEVKEEIIAEVCDFLEKWLNEREDGR